MRFYHISYQKVV